jgi:uncharacterized coiled-coil protein SlyX
VDDKIVLRKSGLGGFKKQDVIDYIAKINESTNNREKKLIAQIGQITRERDELTAQINQLITSSEAQRQRAEAAEENIASQNTTIKNLEKALNDKSCENEENSHELSIMAGEFKIFQEKALKYDELSTNLSETMLDARRTADRYTNESKLRADEIVTNTKIEVERLISESKTQAYTLISKANEEARLIIQQKTELMEKVLIESENFKNISISSRDILTKLSNVFTAQISSADTIISSIEEKIAAFLLSNNSEDDFEENLSQMQNETSEPEIQTEQDIEAKTKEEFFKFKP